jgi:hypothetical protein
MLQALVILLLPWSAFATPWPYTRRFTNASLPDDEHDDEMPNMFIDWLKQAVVQDGTGEVSRAFANETIPDDVRSFSELGKYVAYRHTAPSNLPQVVWDALPDNVTLPPAEEAATLFRYLNFELEPSCVDKREKYWYRTADGSCNWLKAGQSNVGSTGYPRSRDFEQTTYADGISKPREGPNPREVSNAFFKVITLPSIQNVTSPK